MFRKDLESFELKWKGGVYSLYSLYCVKYICQHCLLEISQLAWFLLHNDQAVSWLPRDGIFKHLKSPGIVPRNWFRQPMSSGGPARPKGKSYLHDRMAIDSCAP